MVRAGRGCAKSTGGAEHGEEVSLDRWFERVPQGVGSAAPTVAPPRAVAPVHVTTRACSPARSQHRQREGCAGPGRGPRCFARQRPRSSQRRSPTKALTAPLASRSVVPFTSRRSTAATAKGFSRGFLGIATEYLYSSPRCFHLIGLGDQLPPRACLEAAMAKPCPRFAN